MASIDLITPSLGRDFELCADLHRSVLQNAADDVVHHIIVPREDMELFDRLGGPRARIHCESDFLPGSFISMPFSKLTLNLRRPFPPVRGWILQQVVKLAAAAASSADVVVLVDSDIEFVKPFTSETFVRGGRVRFYRKPGGVDEQLPRHMLWNRVARELLGVAPSPPPYADYIASLIAWDPSIVRQMLAKVTSVTGRPWATAVAGQLHFSEWTLYGVFVEHVLGIETGDFIFDDPLCLAHWGTTPLTRQTARDFFNGLADTDIAAMISAKSGTPLDVKRAAFAMHRAGQSADALLRAAV